jgi:DUF971 family protein
MLKPTSITAERAKNEMTVVWDDGHLSRYPFALLRAGCPCAECRGGHERMSDTPDPAVFTTELPDTPAVHLKTIVPTGSYAISPVWEDGHDAGIFRWDYLRRLCPCQECRGRYDQGMTP